MFPTYLHLLHIQLQEATTTRYSSQGPCLPQSRLFAITPVNDWNSLSDNIVNTTSISQIITGTNFCLLLIMTNY